MPLATLIMDNHSVRGISDREAAQNLYRAWVVYHRDNNGGSLPDKQRNFIKHVTKVLLPPSWRVEGYEPVNYIEVDPPSNQGELARQHGTDFWNN